MNELNNITFDEGVAYLEFREPGPYVSIFSPGAYFLEVWGAQGGYHSESEYAKGGFSPGAYFQSCQVYYRQNFLVLTASFILS